MEYVQCVFDKFMFFEYCFGMKSFIIFLFSLFIFVVYISHENIFSKTRSGEKQEAFVSISSEKLPPILKNYLATYSIRYKFYLMPNYIKEFLSENSDYSSVYNVKPNFTVLVFAPDKDKDKNYTGFSNFYLKLLSESKHYGNNFHILYKDKELTEDLYKDPYDKVAFKDLQNYCGYFCLIDPSNDTLFTFKNITDSETRALEVLFQQYSFLLK